MTSRTASRLAWTLWALNLVLLVASAVTAVSGGMPPGQVPLAVLLPAFQLTSATVGALIAARHPGNPIGWLFLAAALAWGFAGLATGVATLGAAGVIPITGWVRVADWLGSWLFLPGIYVPVTFLFLLFPTGRLPSPRWRWVGVLAATAIALITLESALAPGPLEDAVILKSNPYALGDQAVWTVVASSAWVPVIVGVVASAIALVVRFRRSSGEERQRMKWLAYAAVAVAVLFLLAAAGFMVSDALGAAPILATAVLPAVILFALLLIPVATGIAMLRHRLFDIDVVINRTVGYGVLAAFVTAMYLGIVVGVGALVGSRGSLLLSIVATALIAVAFQPVRERARGLANRLVYGRRASPYEVLATFSQQVGGSVATEEVLPRMAKVLADGTGAKRADVWMRLGAEVRLAATWPPEETTGRAVPALGQELPELPEAERAAPVRHQGELLGALAIAKPANEPASEADERLLADIASQAGLVLRNVRLIEELRVSRQRLVAAQDEERRRLERNIHDGAQQELVALAVQLRLAEQIASKKAPDMAELLARLKAATQEALDNLRDLARGIYPPLLADRGLAAALQAQARKVPFPVEVQPDGVVGRYSQEAEATTYFCVLEALQNVAKYASATRAVVRLDESDHHLVFTVSDDGAGFDVTATPKGAGLQNMADRLDALGGSIEVVSSPGAGTTITGRIPVR
jgi:signal transduction histidine kinase